ncbi:MAG: glutamate racemase [Bacilli bacterium]|nr:glutamate racemase [Bacilli bacterium]
MKIGLFDSGVGGLNVLSEFINKYPNNIYYYYGDTKNVPYGEKDKEILLKLSIDIVKFFEEKQVDLIIIACGTISSTCYEELKKITKIPIIDIITPVINYLKEIEKDNILVFGTKRTIDSHIFKNNLSKNVIEIQTPEFVPMIENFQIDTKIIKNYLSNKDYNVLVLGCTHYPLLIPEFKKYLKEDTLIVDMGKVLVSNLNLTNDFKLEINLFFTKIDDNLLKNINNIIKHKYFLTEV